MSEHELMIWSEALKLVPNEWISEFTRLVEDGECSVEFGAFFNRNAECRRAFEMILRADREVPALIESLDEDQDAHSTQRGCCPASIEYWRQLNHLKKD